MIGFLTTGMILGLSAGIAPGPLMALVISETLQHNVSAGIKVALAPIITDAPIIILTIFLAAGLSEFNMLLGVISFAGGFFILYLGIKIIFSSSVPGVEISDTPSNALRKGILVNALSPHPYLFWFTVGAPMMAKAMAINNFYVIAFIAGFYILLVGSKIALAVIAGKSRALLEGRSYLHVMRILGIILCIFSGLLFRDGFQYVGIWQTF